MAWSAKRPAQMAAVVAVLLVAVVPGAGPSRADTVVSEAAAVMLLPDGPDRLEWLEDVSADGQSALTFGNPRGSGLNRFTLVDVDRGTAHPLPNDPFVDWHDAAGDHAWGARRLEEVVRFDGATGATSTIASFASPVTSVRGSADGRLAAITVFDPVGDRESVFLRTADGTDVSPYPTGIARAGVGATAIDVSPTGRFVVFGEGEPNGLETTIVRYDRVSGERVEIMRPAGLGYRDWIFSHDLRWTVEHRAGIATRRDVHTGAAEVAPFEATPVAVARGGRVVLGVAVPEGRSLYLWDVGAAPRLLTTYRPVEDSGTPTLSADGRRLMLVASGKFGWGLYSLILPPLDAPPVFPDSPRPAAGLGPSATVCVGVVGAEPGEFVVVNVTPVGASGPGDGVVHSGDESAGATSSVNFVAGRADPNVAVARVGVDGDVCFTNSEHGSVDVVLDQLVTGSASVFATPTDGGAVRLVDTRG